MKRRGRALRLSEHLWDAAAQLQGQRMVEDPYADVLEDTFADSDGARIDGLASSSCLASIQRA